MPDLMERIYCSEQIHIPPTFPYIMKLYCKAAIRTQPYDLLKWSAAYFRALANGEEPPAKERVEYPPYDSPSGLTPGFIKILINQFGKDPGTTVTAQTLFKKWSDICLDEYLLIKLIALLGANTTVSWVKFVGVCAGFISKTLTQTMILICELFTEEPEGGRATIPYDLFVDLYIFLAHLECGPITEEEKAELDAIMYEDVCGVADKIKKGIYGEEDEGEMTYGEEIEQGEEEIGEEMEPDEEKTSEDDETTRKAPAETDEEEEAKGTESFQERQGETEEIKETKQDEENEENLEEAPSEKPDDIESLESKEEKSQESVMSGENESVYPEESEEAELKKFSELSQKAAERIDESETSVQEKRTKMMKETKPGEKMVLEELENSIREKIEKKLAEDEDLLGGEEEEEDKDFENLGSYLLNAAARVHKFTAETLGFKIFLRFMRQEVPGIGPRIDSEQIEKVVDFMDSWAHKQEQMVMPRNIRHWMCPPLEKVPAPQP